MESREGNSGNGGIRGTSVQRGGRVAIVKGGTPAQDRAWLPFPDGTARREAVHVIHDLPHLVAEPAPGLREGLRATWPVHVSGLRLR